MQRMQQLQRIYVSVQRAIAATGNRRAYGWKARLERSMIKHLIRNTRPRILQLFQHDLAREHFSFAEADPETSLLTEVYVNLSKFKQLFRQCRPKIDGGTAPLGVSGKSIAFALHPNEAEIS